MVDYEWQEFVDKILEEITENLNEQEILKERLKESEDYGIAYSQYKCGANEAFLRYFLNRTLRGD